MHEKNIEKMIFVFNAVSNGWNVKQVTDKTFEFTKRMSHFEPEKSIEEIVSDFIYASLSYNLLRQV